jgi:hypothetical protein
MVSLRIEHFMSVYGPVYLTHPFPGTVCEHTISPVERCFHSYQGAGPAEAGKLRKIKKIIKMMVFVMHITSSSVHA